MAQFEDVKQVTISEFGRASDTKGSRTTVGEALERVVCDTALQKTIDRIRASTDEGEQHKLKLNLPAVTWSGEFSTRKANNILSHSGMVVLDFDNLTAVQAVKLRNRAKESKFAVAAFISPRGTGVKVLMAVALQDDATHKNAFAACKRHAARLGWPTVDPSGSDCSRLCFLSYDPKAYLAEAFKYLKVMPKTATSPAQHAPGTQESLLEAMDRRVDGVELADVEAMLSVLDPSCGYGEWMGVGMALHAQWSGTEEDTAAQDLFAKWSAGALWHGDTPSNWEGDEDCAGKWESFGLRADGASDITLRSVIKRAKDAGFQVGALLREASESDSLSNDKRKEVTRRDAVMRKEALTLIEGATSLTELTGDVAIAITAFELFDSSREEMLEAFLARYKVLGGGKLSKRAADEVTKYNYAREVTKAGCPEWAAPYVFCREKDGSFISVDTMMPTSIRSFNMSYSSCLITDVMRAQGKLHPYVMPADLLVNTEMIEKVHTTRYVPGGDHVMVAGNGEDVLNTWRPAEGGSSDPLVWSDGDEKAVELWQQHIEWLLGTEHGGMLVQFLAYIVQNPGKRVRWGFLMKGPEGCGKTMIVSQLMRVVLGAGNIDVLDNSTLMHTTFNEWQDSRQLCIVEEVYVEGRAKWDVMNVMKAAITNDTISVNGKGRPKYITQNVTSYILSTNHGNALPLAAGDRRYYVCASRWQGEEFLVDLGGEHKAMKYFGRLAKAAEEHGDALRGWLLGVDLKAFDPNRAKQTRNKERLVQLSKSDTQVTVEDTITGSEMHSVNDRVVELETLKLMLADKGEVISGQLLGRALRDVGYEPVGRHELASPSGEVVKSYWAVRAGLVEHYEQAKDKALFLRALCTQKSEKRKVG